MTPAARRATLLWSGAILALAGLVWLGAGLADRHERSHAAAAARLARFTQGDVAVEILLVPDSAGSRGVARLAARFTPTRAGFHLYAKELPREGISGIGRPTLLELVRAPALRPLGPVAADRPPHQLRVDMLGLSFPVYPAGPVTLSLPVALTASPDRAAELSLTYMACSAGTCLPPVEGRRVVVQVPEERTQ